MFTCPRCKAKSNLLSCDCGYKILKQGNIWQLSDGPDIVTTGDGDKYIGYEFIGENYSGNRKHVIENRDRLFAEEIANYTGNGVFLDLACGDAYVTVLAASLGVSVIAGDDALGKDSSICFDNTKFNEIINYVYGEYWNKLCEKGIKPTKYSWKFDRAAICESLFSHKEEKTIELGKRYEISLKDGFPPRIISRGFSDQVDVPKDIHDKVFGEVLEDTAKKVWR